MSVHREDQEGKGDVEGPHLCMCVHLSMYLSNEEIFFFFSNYKDSEKRFTWMSKS